MDKIFIYEDEKYKNLFPFVYLRPVFDLYCGIFTFRERIQRIYLDSKIYTMSRFDPPITREPHHRMLFINGRAILHSKLPDKEGVFVANGEIVGFNIRSSQIRIQEMVLPIKQEVLDDIKHKLNVIEVECTVIRYLWDLIENNECNIINDYKLWGQKLIKSPSGVFLNEEEGPICIGDGVILRPPTIIDGPCYIGDGSLIDGAKIRKGTTIGKGCRIGGEVEYSVFSDFSNKHHEGFVGHSYIGEWVNLGALTTTSDLKNTYGTVKVYNNNSLVDTGLLKLGAFVGDHTKTGIGTLLDTGSVVGCFVNIYGGGVTPKYISPFSWETQNEFMEYKLDKAIDVAKIVMLRRKKELTREYEQRIREAFELTKKERTT